MNNKIDSYKENPGSMLAIEKGCTCPVLDNNYGKGVSGLFWMDEKCPLHGAKIRKEILKIKEKDKIVKPSKR